MKFNRNIITTYGYVCISSFHMKHILRLKSHSTSSQPLPPAIYGLLWIVAYITSKKLPLKLYIYNIWIKHKNPPHIRNTLHTLNKCVYTFFENKKGKLFVYIIYKGELRCWGKHKTQDARQRISFIYVWCSTLNATLWGNLYNCDLFKFIT